jgi:hypothetical protein
MAASVYSIREIPQDGHHASGPERREEVHDETGYGRWTTRVNK